MSTKKREFRQIDVKELRVVRDDKGAKLAGLIPYNQRSVDLGFFEILAPGCFGDSIRGDVLALRDHDPSKLLGRTTAGTLSFSDQEDGLHYEISLPNTTDGNDLAESVSRGDLSGTSFGFYCIDADWAAADDETVRTVRQAELFEVSPCSFPAYPTSSVSMRSLFPDGTVEIPKPEAPAQDSDEAERMKMRVCLAQALV